jgi:nucleoside-diphosphate-sugar epimerase
VLRLFQDAPNFISLQANNNHKDQLPDYNPLITMASKTGMKHVLVGGLGNLGRHMQRTLLAEGKQVCVVDRLTRSEVLLQRKLVHPTYVEYIPLDLGESSKKNDALLRSAVLGADTVYTMATPDILRATVGEMRTINVGSVQQVINACVDVGVPKLVHMSSTAVTNQHARSVEDTEDVPLPSMDSYKNVFDWTKRLGEDSVLAANSANFQTCAIRPGTILTGASDYFLRHIYDTPGAIHSEYRKSMDCISAKDLSRALLKASEKLNDSESQVAGQAMFVSKCRTSQSVRWTEMSNVLADLLGWKVEHIPRTISVMRQVKLWSMHKATHFTKGDRNDDLFPALPAHVMLDTAHYQQTFDNSLARNLLEFEPEETWMDAMVWIARDITLRHPKLFETKVSEGLGSDLSVSRSF